MVSKVVYLNKDAVSTQVKDVLKKFPQIAGAYWFGSSLGACRPDSDIDIGLVAEDIKLNEKEREHLEGEIRNFFCPYHGHPYDIVLLDLRNSIFSFRVIKEGRLIYACNPDRIADVMEDVSRRYGVSYPRYKAALQEIIVEVLSNGH